MSLFAIRVLLSIATLRVLILYILLLSIFTWYTPSRHTRSVTCSIFTIIPLFIRRKFAGNFPEHHASLSKTEDYLFLLFVSYNKACHIPRQSNPDTNNPHTISYMKTLSYLLQTRFYPWLTVLNYITQKRPPSLVQS